VQWDAEKEHPMSKQSNGGVVVSAKVKSEIEALQNGFKKVSVMLRDCIESTYVTFCNDNKVNPKDAGSKSLYVKHVKPLLISAGANQKTVANCFAKSKVLPKIRKAKRKAGGETSGTESDKVDTSKSMAKLTGEGEEARVKIDCLISELPKVILALVQHETFGKVALKAIDAVLQTSTVKSIRKSA
jgi:hypothetical protein